MELHVTLAERGDRATRIYRELLEAILDGRLRPGERLPPTRELAQRLCVSRNTVAAAYERLGADGFLISKVGAGTFVCAERLGRGGPARSAPAGRDLAPRRIWQDLVAQAAKDDAPVRPAYDFRVGVPDARLFPFETWRRLVASELRPSAIDNVYYDDPAGHAALRAAIARYAGVARSVRAGAADVIVTQGAQQALDLVGRVFIDPGGCVAVEEPGYPEARRLFESQGARVVGIPVDAEGIDVAALPDRARLVYVTPSHQFPLGLPISLARRAALLDWADRRGAVIIEDDYDSEFRFADRPLEPLQSIDRGGRVIYVGTFSKTLLPMLRLGYLVAPATVQPALRLAKRLTDWHGSQPMQGALARFIDEGLLARHVRKATRVYAERHAIVAASLARDFPAWLRPVPAAAGLHVCARLTAEIDLAAVVARAAEAGVAVARLRDYHAGPNVQDGLVLGYGGIATQRIETGLRLLAAAFAGAG